MIQHAVMPHAKPDFHMEVTDLLLKVLGNEKVEEMVCQEVAYRDYKQLLVHDHDLQDREQADEIGLENSGVRAKFSSFNHYEDLIWLPIKLRKLVPQCCNSRNDA